MEYLGGNLNFVRRFLAKSCRRYALWAKAHTSFGLISRRWELTDRELDELLVHKAGLWLDAGTVFGAGGTGFQRINTACPRSILERAMRQLRDAVRSI